MKRRRTSKKKSKKKNVVPDEVPAVAVLEEFHTDDSDDDDDAAPAPPLLTTEEIDNDDGLLGDGALGKFVLTYMTTHGVNLRQALQRIRVSAATAKTYEREFRVLMTFCLGKAKVDCGVTDTIVELIDKFKGFVDAKVRRTQRVKAIISIDFESVCNSTGPRIHRGYCVCCRLLRSRCNACEIWWRDLDIGQRICVLLSLLDTPWDPESISQR